MHAIGGILIAYILAAPLTENISLDLRLTEWMDIWTYIIWFIASWVWGAIFWVTMLLVGTLLAWLDNR